MSGAGNGLVLIGTSVSEQEPDDMVYELYGLTEEERKVVKGL